jgi:hypothetical protein
MLFWEAELHESSLLLGSLEGKNYRNPFCIVSGYLYLSSII